MFAQLPVLIDPNLHDADLAAIADAARAQGLVPVGVLDPDEHYGAAAKAAGLGVISQARSSSTATRTSAPTTPPTPDADSPADGDEGAAKAPPAPRSEARAAARIVDQNVRSGQRLYARGTDLVICGTVSPGAEVMADGNIHIYGALRGRALAGCQGETSAQIFCQRFNAELIAIAGTYRVAEDMDAATLDKPARIQLTHADNPEQSQLLIEGLAQA